MHRFDETKVESPAYVCDLGLLRSNAERLAYVQEQASCKILLALKGFAMWSTFPLLRRYLSGAAASSPDEARLAREEFGGEVHAYAPAYSARDVAELTGLVDHMVFNSVEQWRRFRPDIESASRRISPALRINPEHSEVEVELYDPCSRGSRLGVRRCDFPVELTSGLEGLHFHALCESSADALGRLLAAVGRGFDEHLRRVKWVNFGGGHHITRPGYDVDRLIVLIKDFRERYGVDVYLEPGEAIALGTGVLVASVLDIVQADVPIAILDASATAHMPDVLEMPYRPVIAGAGQPGEKSHTYRLGGLTCLAGDVIGEYSFDSPLAVGQRLVFGDMAHYTMVKTTTFNGVRLPSIVLFDPDVNELRVVRRFGFEDYKGRLS